MTKNCYPYLLDPCPIEYKNKPKYDVTIPFDRIVYVQGQVNYSMIKQENSQASIFSITLKNLLPRLEEKAEYFVRVHKAYIVNMRFVMVYSRTSLTLLDGTEIPIAKRRWKEVSQFFKNLQN